MADKISITKTLETKPEGLGKGELFTGRFELIEELGAGGMGIVYRAYDKEVGEEIALKVLHPDIALDQKTVDRFRNEIKLARRITHKNVCRMHELHQDGKELFITMEYVPGQDLKGLIKESGALATGKAISIAKQVCEGLAEAHDLGVIHRDLKPQNIMVDKEGNAKIMDFGIARSLRAAGMTGEGMIIGTPEYMAPEQVEGLEADQRTDIYAMGAILFEMVTGRVPFEGDSPLSVAYKHKNEPPIPPRKLNTQVPEPLNALVLRCLEKERENRYQTTDEVLADLVRVEDGLPISERVVLKARPTIHITRDKPTGIRRFLVPALALIALLSSGVALWRILLKKGDAVSVNMENSIAVISFENQTSDKTLDEYRKIIPSLLITSLEQTGFYVTSAERQRDILKQVGRGGVEFIDSDLGFEVCRKDGVRSLVTGTIYRAGETFITDVKVLDVRTKRLLRTAKAQGSGSNSIYSSQVDDLSRQIAAGLGVAKEKIDASLKPVSEFGTTSEEAYRHYLKAREYFDHGQYPEARECYQKAVEIDPEFASAYYGLGATYFWEFQRQAAYPFLEKAHSLSHRATEKNRYLIEIDYAGYMPNRNEERYAALIKEFVAKYPKEKEAHAKLADLYMQESNSDKAIEELRIAMALDPTYTGFMWGLGYIHLRRKEYTKAVEYFEKYALAEPEDANAFDSLAEGYFRMGRVAEAKATWSKLLEKWPHLAVRFDGLQYVCALEENYGEAVRRQDRTLEVCAPQEKPAIYAQRGFYRGWAGDLNGALGDLQRADESAEALKTKGWVIARRLRSWIYFDQHQLDLSRKSLEEFLALAHKERPERSVFYDAQYYDLLCRVECEEGKLDSAEARWKEVEALIPKVEALVPPVQTVSLDFLKHGAQWLRPELRLAQSRIDEVIGFLEKTPPQPPRAFNTEGLYYPNYNVPFLRDVLARAYAKRGDLNKAIAEYERLTTFDYRSEAQFLIHPKYHYRLGLLYEQKGQKVKAAERYRKFLDLWKAADPAVPEVADAKKRLAALS